MGDSNTPTKLISLDNLETYHGLMDAKKEEQSVTLTYAQYELLPTSEKMNGKTYYISDASDGSIVTPNPVDTPTGTLETIGIGNVVYEVGGGTEVTPFTTEQMAALEAIINGTYT